MTNPSDVALPAGFELLPPGTIMEYDASGARRPRFDLRLRDILDADPRAAPTYSWYGGATVTEIWDAVNTRFMGADSKHPDGWFGWTIFNYPNNGSSGSNVPLDNPGTGRGSVNPNAYARIGEWVSWEGSNVRRGLIPGFVQFAEGTTPAPQPPGPMNGSIYTPCIPMRQNAAYNGVQLADGPINMHAAFGVPNDPIKAYVVRFVAASNLANVRGRLGPDQANPIAYTINTPAPGVEAHGGMLVNCDAAGNLYYSAVNGRPFVWLQLLGWLT